MSCGNPHDIPCSEVLDRVYEYLDGEIDGDDRAKVKQHLDECHPCLKEFGLEEAVKALVKRSCGHDAIPEDLRAKVLAKIAGVREQVQGEPTA
jgi:mycothiol system anti-sigma-R factor